MSRRWENDRIPPQALAVILISALAELNFLSGPREVVAAAGRDAWLSVILALLVLALAIWVNHDISRRFPRETLVEIAQGILGRPLGIAVVLFYVAFWILRSAMLLQLESHLFTTRLLTDTPGWVISLYMLVASTYIVRHGIEPMARLFIILLALYFPPLWLLVTGTYIAGTDPLRLQPFLASGAGPVLRGTWVAYAQAPGIEVLLMIGPLLTRFRGSLSAAFIGLALIALPAVGLTAALIASFGAIDVVEHTWPTLALLELIKVPGFTGFRVDPIFVALWTLTVFASLSLSHYLASAALLRLLRLKSNRGPVFATAATIGLLAVLPVGLPLLLPWIETARLILVPLATLGLPLLLAALGALRRLGRKAGNNTLQ